MSKLTEAEILLTRRECRHFNGMQNGTCLAGVAYASVGRPIPCLPALRGFGLSDPDRVEACPRLASRTRAEVIAEHEETEAFTTAFLARLVAFVEGTDRRCIHCSRDVTSARKIGRCVYVYPCGCRLYQGRVPDWARQAGTQS